MPPKAQKKKSCGCSGLRLLQHACPCGPFLAAEMPCPRISGRQRQLGSACAWLVADQKAGFLGAAKTALIGEPVFVGGLCPHCTNGLSATMAGMSLSGAVAGASSSGVAGASSSFGGATVPTGPAAMQTGGGERAPLPAGRQAKWDADEQQWQHEREVIVLTGRLEQAGLRDEEGSGKGKIAEGEAMEGVEKE